MVDEHSILTQITTLVDQEHELRTQFQRGELTGDSEREQLAALELMAIDPRQRVLAPRFIAGMISMPLLAILFTAIGILGAWLVAVGLIGIDPGNFWSIQQNGVDVWRDVGNGVVKSAVFGVICTAVALYQGYETEATPEGVAYATTRTVVISSLAVLFMDFVLTAWMFSTPGR